MTCKKQKISAVLNDELVKSLITSIGSNKDYKKRFLVKIGTHIKAVENDNVNYFYSFQKGTFLKSGDGKNYLLDQTLETIEQLVNPAQFFRINRKYLVLLTL
jgi:DNA-binding LytR/AlgR family response regulator